MQRELERLVAAEHEIERGPVRQLDVDEPPDDPPKLPAMLEHRIEHAVARLGDREAIVGAGRGSSGGKSMVTRPTPNGSPRYASTRTAAGQRETAMDTTMKAATAERRKVVFMVQFSRMVARFA